MTLGLWYYVEPARLTPLAGLVFGVYGSFAPRTVPPVRRVFS